VFGYILWEWKSIRQRPFVSIVILNFNGKRFINTCLSSVFKTSYERFEVVLVDNASTDGSLDTLSGDFLNSDRLKIVRNPMNVGYGPANNIGYAHAVGDYIVFLNNDTVVDPGWLESLVTVLENDSSIGLAQSLILDMKTSLVQTAGWLVSDYFVGLYSIRFDNNVSVDSFPGVFEVSYASGAAMIIKRELVEEIGLFDPKYFWFYDDNYLSFKSWLVGKRVVVVTNSRVFHAGGGTAGFDSHFIRHHGTVCLESLILDVYWRPLSLAKAIFVFFYNLSLASLKEVVEKHVTTRFWANISATLWVLKNLKYLWRNRVKYQNMARVSPGILLSSMFRIHVPSSFYLVPSPSKLLWYSLADEAKKYQRDLVSGKNRDLTSSGD
jgi:GT2 family glycosyltransferase